MNTDNSEPDTGVQKPEPEQEAEAPKTEPPKTEPPEPEQPEPEPVKPEPARAARRSSDSASEKTPKAARSRSGLSVLALLVALGSLAGTAWMWWQDQQMQATGDERVFTEIARLEESDQNLGLKINELRNQVDGMPVTDHSGAVANLEAQLESGVSTVEGLQKSYAEQLALSRSLQAATESMQARLLAAEAAVAGVATLEQGAGNELDLAEVDYLLRLANERLKLFDDPVAADEVLKLADIHLEAINNPMYLGVRQEIAVARQALAGVEVPDYFAISNELDGIQSSLSGLRFRDEAETIAESEPESETPVEEGWWARLKGAFSGLVTVRRSTDLENERISVADRDYVHQRLWLQLEIAHLSLMRRDQQAFENSLERVRQTLTEWFVSEDETFQSIDSRLLALEETSIHVDVPDITQPWATLRLVRGGQSRPAAVAPATSEDVSQAVNEADAAGEPEAGDEATPTGHEVVEPAAEEPLEAEPVEELPDGEAVQ